MEMIARKKIPIFFEGRQRSEKYTEHDKKKRDDNEEKDRRRGKKVLSNYENENIMCSRITTENLHNEYVDNR